MADEYDVLGLLPGNENQDNTAKATNEFQAAWEDAQSESLRHLKNIDKNVAEMLKKGIPMSQGAARDAASRSRDREYDRDAQEGRTRSRKDGVFGRPNGMKRGQRLRHDGQDDRPPEYAKGTAHKARWEKELGQFNEMLDSTYTQFFDELEDGILDQLGFFNLTDSVKASLTRMADSLGVNLENVGPELGRMAAQNIAAKFGETDFGKGLKNSLSGVFGRVSTAFSGMADSLDRDVIKTPKDAARVHMNRQNRWADEAEYAFEAADERASYASQQYAKNSTVTTESGESIPTNASVYTGDLSIIAQGQINISAQNVTLSVNNPFEQQGYRDQDGQSRTGPFDRSQSWADDEDLVTVDENYQPIDHSSFDTSEMASNFADNAGDIIDIIDTVKGGGGKGELVAKGAQMIGKGQGTAGAVGKGISGLLGSGGGAAASGSTALATTGSTALATSGTAAGGAMTAAGGGAMTAAGGGAMAAGGSGALAAAGPYGWIALVVIAIAKPLIQAALTSIMTAFNDVKEKWGELKEDIGDAFNRSAKSAEDNQELAQKRYEADVKSLIEAPFKILEDAAQKIYDAWDENLRKINATQGYDKAGLQDLMSDYADRLRREGLASVIGTNDITDNLSKVLDSGMSGQIAEEFAYIATKLNAAIPTQDFFSYGETYVSLAAQAMQAGKSQAEAIAYANKQLESFASGVLYANRTLTGGFTTGLQDADTLFKQATQIAQSAKSQNASQIASVLTAVSGIVGGIAPDLAVGLIDAIYNAAVGGNNSSIVALRSIAGINASNTEFLRELASNPQKVFSDMFKGLANIQNMSQDNYMEVAEALADTFDVSMDAIARVDFNYLARAIDNMDANSSALSENIAHLASGETTTSAEAHRLAKINEYMIEEGLSYVLDNEVARSIQEHMWDEQIARELMEATYAVELQGSALSFLQSIMSFVDKIATVLSPLRLMSKIQDLVATVAEGFALQADIVQTLQLGQVGKGNLSAFHDLVTRNADLNLTHSYIALQGGISTFAAIEGFKDLNHILNPLGSFGGGIGATHQLTTQVNQQLLEISDMAANSVPTYRRNAYSWGRLSKSSASVLADSILALGGAGIASGSSLANTLNNSTAAQDQANAKLIKLLEGEYIKDQFVAQGKTYEDWVKHARSQGFADIDAALNAAGLSVDDVKGQFTRAEGQLGSEIAAQNEAREKMMQEIVILNTPLIVEHLKKQEAFQTWQKDEAWEAIITWGQNIQHTLGDPNEPSIQSLLGNTGDKGSIIGILGGEGGILHTLKDEGGILDHIISIDNALNDKSGGMQKLLQDMTDYVVKHNVYNQSLNGSTTNSGTSWYDSIRQVQLAEKDEASTAIYSLVDALTSNMVDLRDPQVAGNALLAEILNILKVMHTQQAGTGGSKSLADSLIGLALGYTPTTV